MIPTPEELKECITAFGKQLEQDTDHENADELHETFIYIKEELEDLQNFILENEEDLEEDLEDLDTLKKLLLNTYRSYEPVDYEDILRELFPDSDGEFDIDEIEHN